MKIRNLSYIRSQKMLSEIGSGIGLSVRASVGKISICNRRFHLLILPCIRGKQEDSYLTCVWRKGNYLDWLASVSNLQVLWSDGDNEQRIHLESHELKSERDCYDISLTQGNKERISPALHARMTTQLLRDSDVQQRQEEALELNVAVEWDREIWETEEQKQTSVGD